MTIVVPCYDEEARLRPDAFVELAAREDLALLFVDDGSTDGTWAILEGLAAKLGTRGTCLRLERNAGKAEAVRRGMLVALERGASIVGYLDADLSTPVDEVIRLLGALRSRPVSVVMGSRVAMLGTRIERRALRHYSSRVFASVASLVLGVAVYDTQCGAKLFRSSALLREVLSTPFTSRWAFDVELMDRLLTGGASQVGLSTMQFLEVPLLQWHDVGASKVRPAAMVKASLDLLRLGLRGWRRRWARVRAMFS